MTTTVPPAAEGNIVTTLGGPGFGERVPHLYSVSGSKLVSSSSSEDVRKRYVAAGGAVWNRSISIWLYAPLCTVKCTVWALVPTADVARIPVPEDVRVNRQVLADPEALRNAEVWAEDVTNGVGSS